MATFILVLSHPVHSQYYDLTVGTERHYAGCRGLLGICPASANSDSAIEKVVAYTDIDGKTWAVVIWTGWAGSDSQGDPNQVFSDTTYYRMEGSVLFEYAEGAEQAIFDYGFSKGDSVMSILSPYVSDEDIQNVSNNYFVGQEGVASVILIDTLLQFIDGSFRHILWGDDTLIYVGSSGVKEFIPPDKLDFVYRNQLPVPIYPYINPFYFIKGMGVILTPFNHRGQMMCGYKDSDGNHYGCEAPIITSVDDSGFASIPTDLITLQSYPNPFNPQTVIRFQLPAESRVRLTVYDILGRRVEVLAYGTFSAGTHEAVFNAANLSSGVYLYRLEHETGVLTGKMLLMK